MLMEFLLWLMSRGYANNTIYSLSSFDHRLSSVVVLMLLLRLNTITPCGHFFVLYI